MTPPFDYGEGHDWQLFSKGSEQAVGTFVCHICRSVSNDDPPFKCPGPIAGKRIWSERLRKMNPRPERKSPSL